MADPAVLELWTGLDLASFCQNDGMENPNRCFLRIMGDKPVRVTGLHRSEDQGQGAEATISNSIQLTAQLTVIGLVNFTPDQ